MHKIVFVVSVSLAPLLAHGGDETTPIYRDKDIEVNMLSDFESGTRLHHAGKIDMAITMFRQGAQKGDPKSMFALGTYYYFGEGVPKDFAEARTLFHAAADKGHGESAYLLSLMYGRGEGVKADTGTALTYLKQAAHGCVGEAQNQLAQMYYEGGLVPKDQLNGIAWLALAAEHENKETQATVRQIKANLSKDDRARVSVLEQQHRSELKCAEE